MLNFSSKLWHWSYCSNPGSPSSAASPENPPQYSPPQSCIPAGSSRGTLPAFAGSNRRTPPTAAPTEPSSARYYEWPLATWRENTLRITRQRKKFLRPERSSDIHIPLGNLLVALLQTSEYAQSCDKWWNCCCWRSARFGTSTANLGTFRPLPNTVHSGERERNQRCT